MSETKTVTKFQMEGIEQFNRKRLASLPAGLKTVGSETLCPRDGTELVYIDVGKKFAPVILPVVCPNCGVTSFKVNF